MFRAIKSLGALAFLTVGLMAQSGVTPYANISNNVVLTGTFPVPGAYNIGQAFHIITLIPRDITAASCSGAGGWIGTLRLEGSFDNASWGQIGTAITSANTINVPSSAAAQGSYAYLRLNYLSGNFAQCKIDIWYSGNLYGTPVVLPPFQTLSFNPNVNTEQILLSCNRSKASIYSLTLVNDNAANGFTFRTKQGATCLGGSIINQLILPDTFPANGEFILPLGTLPYTQATADGASTTVSCFTIQATNATLYHVMSVGRCE